MLTLLQAFGPAVIVGIFVGFALTRSDMSRLLTLASMVVFVLTIVWAARYARELAEVFPSLYVGADADPDVYWFNGAVLNGIAAFGALFAGTLLGFICKYWQKVRESAP